MSGLWTIICHYWNDIAITLVGLLTGIYSGETFTDGLETWLMQFEIVWPELLSEL